MYKFGDSPNIQDEIRCKKGIYHIFLNRETRDGFHELLRSALSEVALLKEESFHTPSADSQTKSPKTIPDQESKTIRLSLSRFRNFYLF